MSFNFSALQFERDFAAKSVCNWEYPRFSPPRPRTLTKTTKPCVDNNGHLLPSAAREGNFLGQYRGTYHLPLRITRSFASVYDRCLSGRYKYAKYPRDLCCCQRERPHPCDFRETLGKEDEPLWQRPSKCQTKCEGLQQLLFIDELHKKCKHKKCQPKPNEKLIPRTGDASSRYNKKLRKRPVTAFEYNRRGTVTKDDLQTADKNKTKKANTAPSTAPATPAAPATPSTAPGGSANASEKSTARSTTKAPPKSSKSKTK